jgi:hypothetical protein
MVYSLAGAGRTCSVPTLDALLAGQEEEAALDVVDRDAAALVRTRRFVLHLAKQVDRPCKNNNNKPRALYRDVSEIYKMTY